MFQFDSNNVCGPFVGDFFLFRRRSVEDSFADEDNSGTCGGVCRDIEENVPGL